METSITLFEHKYYLFPLNTTEPDFLFAIVFYFNQKRWMKHHWEQMTKVNKKKLWIPRRLYFYHCKNKKKMFRSTFYMSETGCKVDKWEFGNRSIIFFCTSHHIRTAVFFNTLICNRLDIGRHNTKQEKKRTKRQRLNVTLRWNKQILYLAETF